MTHNSRVGERGSELLSLHEARPSDDKGRCHGAIFSFVQRTALTSERSSLPRFLALPAALLLLAALPAGAKPKPAAVQTAVIENTGSTNTLGYQILVFATGSVGYDYKATKPSGPNSITSIYAKTSTIPKDRAKKLFQDLAAAMPLTSLPVRHGMRSASFGTQTTITYKGQQSPDLTFASDPRTAALKADIDAITKSLHVGNAPRRPIVLHLNSANTPGTQK